MALGRKTGGRKKGTPNRFTQAVEERVASFGCDPVEVMAKMAIDATVPPGLRLRAAESLLEYIRPKLSRVEHTGQGGGELFSIEAIRAYMATRPGATVEPIQ